MTPTGAPSYIVRSQSDVTFIRKHLYLKISGKTKTEICYAYKSNTLQTTSSHVPFNQGQIQ
jgi:hypothetical protein